MLTVKINTDNEALRDSDGSVAVWEIARILRAMADGIEEGRREGRLMDANGNACGSFKLTGGKKS